MVVPSQAIAVPEQNTVLIQRLNKFCCYLEYVVSRGWQVMSTFRQRFAADLPLAAIRIA
jgi:hypothetical protein